MIKFCENSFCDEEEEQIVIYVKINQSEKRKGAEIQTIWFTPLCVVDIDPVVEFGFGMTIVGNIPLFLSSFVSDANRMRDSEFFFL